MKKINFVNGTTIDGAETFNQLQDNVEEVFNGEEAMGSIVVEDVIGKNLCDGINQKYFLTIAVNVCNRASGNSGLIIGTNGGKYTISTTSSQERYRVACIDTLPTSGDVTAYNGVNKDGTSDSITIDTAGHNYLVVNATDLTKIQIEKGSTATEYTEFKKFGYNSQESMGEIVVDDITSKNLISQLVYDGIGNVGTTYQNIDNKKIIVNANNNIWGWVQFTINNIPTNQELTYSSDVTSDGNAIINAIIYDVNDNIIGRFDNTTETKAKAVVSFTSPTETIKIRFSANNSGTYLTNTAIFDNLMIEKGDKATPYTPYKEFGNKQVYSSAEQVIGEWLGQPLYRRVYAGYLVRSYIEGDMIFSFIHDSTLAMNRLIDGKGFVMTNDYQFIPFNSASLEIRYNGDVVGYNTILLTYFDETLEGKYYEVAVEYTKATDTQSASTMSLRPDTTEVEETE